MITNLYHIKDIKKAYEAAAERGLLDPLATPQPECPFVCLDNISAGTALVQPLGILSPMVSLPAEYLQAYEPQEMDLRFLTYDVLSNLRFVYLDHLEIPKHETYYIGSLNQVLSGTPFLCLHRTYEGDVYPDNNMCDYMSFDELTRQVKEKKLLIYRKTPQGESS